MLDIGIPELLIILAIFLIVFGPGRLAGIGQALGQTIRGFRNAVQDESTAPITPAAPEQKEVVDVHHGV